MGWLQDNTHDCIQCYHHKYCPIYPDKYKPNQVCLNFVDGREPNEVTFSTLGQLENYLREFFYVIDFEDMYTRKQLAVMLRMLFPYLYERDEKAFSSMCKGRMVKHIEFYIQLRGLYCKR